MLTRSIAEILQDAGMWERAAHRADMHADDSQDREKTSKHIKIARLCRIQAERCHKQAQAIREKLPDDEYMRRYCRSDGLQAEQ